MKKKILILSLLCAFSLAGCDAPADGGGQGGDNNPPSQVDETFTITWKNYDGTVLETDREVKKGVVPTYDGATPTKPEDANNTYTFSGWTPTVVAAAADAVYTATFTSTPIPTYTITWKNWDGTVLETDREVKKGVVPTYDGATPTRAEDANNTYAFSGWTPTVVAASANATYTATFRATPIPSYTIKWVNYDDSVLETDSVKKGAVPTYDGTTPTKPEDDNFIYTFSGWSPTVVAASADATYKAQFTSTAKVHKYTITWKNWDGTVLETDENVVEGTVPTYDGETPTKPEDENYTYSFSGWDPEVVAAAGNAVYTAQFTSTAKIHKYTIKWKNYDGTVLETDENVVEGTVPTYDGETPTKPEDENYTYSFSGWDPEVVAASADAIYTAQFTSTAKVHKYTITWKNYDGSVLETDENVEEGTIPTYDGETPTKPEDENYTYTFSGWDPEVVAATEDAVYTAQFNATSKGGETPDIGTSWPADKISAFLTSIGCTTSSVPALNGAATYYDYSDGDVFFVGCLFNTLEEATTAHASYTETLATTFTYNETFKWYSNAEIIISAQLVTDSKAISVSIMKNDIPAEDDEYPSEAIASFITNYSITDPVPSFTYDNAKYMLLTEDGGVAFLVVPPAEVTTAALFNHFKSMLDDSENFTYSTEESGMYMYYSLNSQFIVTIGQNMDSGVIIGLQPNELPPYQKDYPTESVASYLNGVEDTYSEFSIKSAAGYSFAGPDEEAEIDYAELVVYFDGEEDINSVVNGFKGGLETLGYGLKTGSKYGEMLVSPNKQVGFNIEEGSSAICIRMYNLTEYSDTFTVDYFMYCNQNWIYNDNAKFYAWIWGGEYGEGQWIELNLEEENDQKYFALYNINDNANGMKIVRFAENSRIAWEGDGVTIYNQTGDIALNNNTTVFNITFNG